MSLMPGAATSFSRVSARPDAWRRLWDRIYGYDNLIAGAQQGTIPGYQGGERVNLFGGLDYHVAFPGFKPIRVAVEAGAPVYQRLNGPQLGQSWQLNTAIGFGF
jgi:hypothetical protein